MTRQEEEDNSYYHWFIRNGKRIRLERMWPLEVFRARQVLAPGESYQLATPWEVLAERLRPKNPWRLITRFAKRYWWKLLLALGASAGAKGLWMLFERYNP